MLKDSPRNCGKNCGKNCEKNCVRNCADDICRRWSEAWEMMIIPKYVTINDKFSMTTRSDCYDDKYVDVDNHDNYL